MLTGIDITAITEIAEGAAFGGAGAYRRIIGTARGELDPDRPENRGIVNLDRAPRNARGRVEYHCDVFILHPADPAKGNGRLLYEVSNRGRKLLFSNLCAGSVGSDLRTRADFGDGLPLRLGFSVVWSGWDATVASGNAALGLSAPAPLEGGRAIIRTIRDEFVAGTRPDSPTEFFRLSYAATTLDQAQARLTRRRRQADPRATVPAAEWEFLDQRRVRLLPAGQRPEPGTLYELTYLARDPVPLGIGLAATRDVVSYLRYDAASAELLGRPAEPRAGFRHLAGRAVSARPHRPGLQPRRGRPPCLRRRAGAYRRDRPGVPEPALRPAFPHQYPARGPRFPRERLPVLAGGDE